MKTIYFSLFNFQPLMEVVLIEKITVMDASPKN